MHNPLTHNFQRLLLHVLDLIGEVPKGLQLQQAANALQLVAAVLKFVVEHASGTAVQSLFAGSHTLPFEAAGLPSLLPIFTHKLLMLIAATPARDDNYLVLLAAVKALIAGSSSQLYSTAVVASAEAHPILDALMSQEHLAPLVVQSLLHLTIDWPSLPSSAQVGA